MTKIDKMNIAPWQENGRWYHVFIESDGTDAVLTVGVTGVTDSISNSALTFVKGFHVIDWVNDYTTDNDTSAKTIAKTLSVTAGNKHQIPLLNVAAYTSADIWIFGRFE